MILLQVNNVTRRFGDVTLFKDVSFTIQDNDRIALVGRNGTGKSTLIQQIMNQEPINEGEITKAKDVNIGYLEQHVVNDSALSIWDEMMSTFQDTLKLRDQAGIAAERVADLSVDTESQAYQEALASYDHLNEQLHQLNAYSIESEVKKVLHGFRFYEEDYDTPVRSLSGGQKTRLALAQLLLMRHDLLILDEPTNHLDMDMLRWLEDYLVSYQGALLIVSHDRYFLDRVAKQVVELRNETSHIYKGNYSFYIKEKALRLEQEWAAFTRQQQEIAKLEDYIQRNIARASTTGMAQSRRKKLERMDRIKRPQNDPQAPRIQFSANSSSGDRVIEAVDLAIGYDRDLPPIAKDIDFDLRRQQAIAIVGANGVGKTTLLRTILNEIKPLSGEVIMGTGVSIGYYDQNVNHLDPKLSVLETLWQAHDTTDEKHIRSILGSFLFRQEDVEKTVGMLSGGEKARLALALLATDHDNTLLLDEPTNHLDIDSKEVLEEALIDFDGTLLFVSHDRYFINRIATQVLEITPTGSRLYLGDYDYYLAKKEELDAIEALTEPTEEEVAPVAQEANYSYEESRRLRSQLRRLEKESEETLHQIDEIEEQIQHLHQAMSDASMENDSERLTRLHNEATQMEEEVMELMTKWEALTLETESFKEEHPTIT